MEQEDVRVSATHACAELLRHGVTCFIDPGNYHPEASVAAAKATGIRTVAGRSSFDLTKSVMGLLPARMIEDTAVCLKGAEEVLERYHKSGDPRLEGQRLVPRPEQRIRRADQGPQEARRQVRHAAADARLLLLLDARRLRVALRPGRDRADGAPRRARRAHAGRPLRLARAAGSGDAGQAQAVARMRAVVVAAQRLRQLRRRQDPRADGVRRQRFARLGSCLVGHRRHGPGDAVGCVRLQGNAHEPARHAARARHRDGDHQRRQGRAMGRPRSARSKSAKTPTSCCSTRCGPSGSR